MAPLLGSVTPARRALRVGFACLALVAGVGLAGPAVAVIPATHQDCGSDSYVNVDGVCVHDPVHSDAVPSGGTAVCFDGSYSFSLHHRGTCSHHGGVARFLDE